MILSCNSCEKKFVVPDNAISASGRLVQCSSCGNKWKQFPVTQASQVKKEVSKIKAAPKKTQNLPKKTKRKIKRKTGPNLYSPEYLAKKHGIKISSNSTFESKESEKKTKIGFGFYNFMLVSIILSIAILRLLHFTQDIIIDRFPITEIYIDYLFEAIRNIKDIIFNFFFGY